MYNREDTQRFLAQRVARPGSSAVIIENEAGEVLVLKAHYKPYWSFPGGWIEHGQTPREAALRELEEETGIVLSEKDLRLAFVVDRKSDIMQTYQFVFEAINGRGSKEDLHLQTDEIDDCRFVSRDHVLSHQEEFGGAVAMWAQSDNARYYEHTI